MDSLLTETELAIVRRVNQSKMWRLIRDALCLERERIFNNQPSFANDREIWLREGRLQAIQYLLREGPLLAVYYERHRQAAQDAPRTIIDDMDTTTNEPRVGSPPDLGDL